MVDENLVSEHYAHNGLLESIEHGLGKLGKSRDTVTVEDLAPVDEFHIGGRAATEHLLSQLAPDQSSGFLDIGCGLGGASRFVAKKYGAVVTGIDLTESYVTVGDSLSRWVGLEDSVTLHHGTALSMPFESASFDGAYMLHVGMNIQEKDRLFAEIARVLKTGAKVGVYDVMRTSDGKIVYPVPWAANDSFSFLERSDKYTALLESVGFEIECVNDRKEFALEFFKQLKEKTENSDGSPALGLHLLMQSTTPTKIKNMIENIVNGRLSPTEIIAKKL